MWASCFAALGDPTRLMLVQLLAANKGPMTVGEITARLDIGQSTVSHHLAKLAEVRFVVVQHVGTSSQWRLNSECLNRFPTAVDVVMGRADPTVLDDQGPAS